MDKKNEVSAEYCVLDRGRFAFQLGEFDRELPLTIVAQLTWSTYFGGPGGEGNEVGQAVVVDDSGNSYVAGHTPAADYAATVGVIDRTWNGGRNDVFVTKLNIDGSDLIDSTFLGGSENDRGFDIVIHGPVDVIVVGETGSGIFPTTSGVYGETQNGYGDAFVACFHSSCLAANLELWPGITALDFINCLNGNQMGSGRLRLEMTLSPKNCKISDVALMPKTTAIRTPIF